MSDFVAEMRFVERDGKKILQYKKRSMGGGGESGPYVCQSVFDKWVDVPLATVSDIE